MNRRPLIVINCLMLALVNAATVAAQPDSTRIMPLGDSITESTVGFSSYRYWLWQELVDAGHGVDFVGSMYGVYGGLPANTDFDIDHEGHWGWRVDDILSQINGWAFAHQPEIVLIHLGHNDLFADEDVAETIAELGLLIDEMRLVDPATVFFLARIIPCHDIWEEIVELNEGIPPLAATKSTPQSPVLVVDQWTGFDPDADTFDGIHPNQSGEQKISARWFNALDDFMNDDNLPPADLTIE